MALSETLICNQSLAKIGSKRINNYEDADEASLEAIQCRQHYESTRDALLRSFEWPFAAARAKLSEDTSAPAFEWDNQFLLPADFLRLKLSYLVDDSDYVNERFEIEGNLYLTNDTEVQIKYIKKVTDPTKFDTLFVKLFVCELALDMLPALGGTNTAVLTDKIQKERDKWESKARTVCRQEVNVSGRHDWLQARNDGDVSQVTIVGTPL